MNEADALRAASLLERSGFRPVDRADEASLLLLNTCVVRQQAEDKIYSRLSFVADLKRREPTLTVVLMGCLVGKNNREWTNLKAKFPFVDLFLPPSDISPLQDHLRHFRTFNRQELPVEDMPPPPLPDSQSGRAVVAHLPVVLGCSHACTYCVIPYRRGGERSRPSAEIMA